jgi:hypothetical protein
MYNDSDFTVQTNKEITDRRTDQYQMNGALSEMSPEERWKQEVAMHLHRKNQKKYTHLYQLEKYFR